MFLRFLVACALLVWAQSASHNLTIDWIEPFSHPSARNQTVPPGARLEFAWEGKHNVYAMRDHAAWESCDFTQV